MEVAFSPKPALHLNVIDGSLCWNSSKKKKLERAGLSERLNRDKAPPFQEGTIQALFKISKSEWKLMKKQTALCFSSVLENSG